MLTTLFTVAKLDAEDKNKRVWVYLYWQFCSDLMHWQDKRVLYQSNSTKTQPGKIGRGLRRKDYQMGRNKNQKGELCSVILAKISSLKWKFSKSYWVLVHFFQIFYPFKILFPGGADCKSTANFDWEWQGLLYVWWNSAFCSVERRGYYLWSAWCNSSNTKTSR